MNNNFLKLPFERFDTPFLETLPDEIFFAKRFVLSENDAQTLLKHSVLIDGKRFYKAKVKDSIMKKYAALTNPKEGEAGSKTNPLIRFGKKYVYNLRGDLVRYKEQNNK